MRISDWSSDVCSSDLIAEAKPRIRSGVTSCSAEDESVSGNVYEKDSPNSSTSAIVGVAANGNAKANKGHSPIAPTTPRIVASSYTRRASILPMNGPHHLPSAHHTNDTQPNAQDRK